MSELKEGTCEPCRVGAPPATEAEIQEWLNTLRGWEVLEVDGIPRLKKTYEFQNFQDALDFTNRVGACAEENGHHPALLTEWGKVTVSWWTHKIEGLHRNDFIMAAKTDALGAGG